MIVNISDEEEELGAQCAQDMKKLIFLTFYFFTLNSKLMLLKLCQHVDVSKKVDPDKVKEVGYGLKIFHIQTFP